MVIISTKPVAAIIHAVSALSMVLAGAAVCAKATELVSVAASAVMAATRRE
jgi:hypothetical protein